MNVKKLYEWYDGSEGGYSVCDDDEDLTNTVANYGDYEEITRYFFIGKFSTKEELKRLLKREREPDVEFWADALCK